MLSLTDGSDIEEFGIFADLGKRIVYFIHYLYMHVVTIYRYATTSYFFQ